MAASSSAAQAIDEADGFGRLFAEYHPAIYRYALRLIGNAEDAADLTLATFEKALRAWPRRPAEPRVRPWLYRIATNTCLDELRHRRLIRWLPLDPTDPSAPQPVADDDPEDAAIRAEEVADVRAALARLPERYRVALTLREGQGLSCDEIGEALGISRGAAKVLLFRAREKLRQAYFGHTGEARP